MPRRHRFPTSQFCQLSCDRIFSHTTRTDFFPFHGQTVITTQWSSSDCSVPIDNERVSSSPSPDIVDESQEAMVEPSSSSASSTASTSRPPFKAKVRLEVWQLKEGPSLLAGGPRLHRNHVRVSNWWLLFSRCWAS